MARVASHYGAWLPQGRKEPEAAYRQRLANAPAERLLLRCPEDLCRNAGLGAVAQAA